MLLIWPENFDYQVIEAFLYMFVWFDFKTIVSENVIHAYLVRVNYAVVNKWEGSVDEKPENSCCQLLLAFFAFCCTVWFYRTSKQVDTVFISLNLEMITTALFGAAAAISNVLYPVI